MRHRTSHEFLAFSEYDCSSITHNQKEKIISEINSLEDNYILNVNKEEFTEHIISKFTIPPIKIDSDQISVSTYEAQIQAEDHPHSYHFRSNQSYPRDIIRFHLPYTGDPQLFKVRASKYTFSPPRIIIEKHCVCFEIINFNLTSDEITREQSNTVSKILQHNQYLTGDLEKFNNQIPDLVKSSFESRKQAILDKNNLIASLGVPIHKSGSVPNTFSIPTKRKQIIPNKKKPIVTEKGFTPEPTLDSEIYNQILTIIHDVGKQFERLPSTYSEKDEESLRDHILLILEPNFEGSATGETFNKSGKTDILLRHENSNVFIAELKFWKGKKSYLETIDQLLSYLTWRDSKAAVIMFVRNIEFSPVLETVKIATPEHKNFLSSVSEKDESCYHYRFHLNGDKNREVQISVMLFHIPTS